MLGGDISVDSSFGRGSSFMLSVSTGSLEGVRMFEDLTEAGIPETGAVVAHETSATQVDATVLLAEDGLDNQVLIAKHLTRAGITVTVVENGELAMQKALAAALAGRPYDVILMDMQMPVMDGYAATSALRRKGYKGPIVALTAHAMAGDRERCIAAGCTDYLTKPITRKKLIEAVSEHAKRAPAHGVALEIPMVPAVSDSPRAANDDVIVSEFADDAEMTELVEGFVAGLGDSIERAQVAMTTNDMVVLQRVAHQLKGAAGGYGFMQITEAAASLEHAVRQRDEGVPKKLAEVISLCRRARARRAA
jgi:CheY-like chemotaxis protein/HPt (histidine-containing phosphotransfer) domain-containing protein